MHKIVAILKLNYYLKHEPEMPLPHVVDGVSSILSGVDIKRKTLSPFY